MDIDDLKAKLDHFNPLTELDAARLLAAQGEAINEKMAGTFNHYPPKFPTANTFMLAILESAVWASYAKRTDKFFELGTNYLEKGNEEIFSKLGQFVTIFEEGKLESHLKSWKKILEAMQSYLSPHKYSAMDLVNFQQKTVNDVPKLAMHKGLSQIGAWILFSPFGILAISSNQLWSDSNLDRLLMPQGEKVIAGRSFLQKRGLQTAAVERVESDQDNLMSGLTIAFLNHKFEKKLAELAQSRVIHINTGLYSLGGGEEDLYLLPEK